MKITIGKRSLWFFENTNFNSSKFGKRHLIWSLITVNKFDEATSVVLGWEDVAKRSTEGTGISSFHTYTIKNPLLKAALPIIKMIVWFWILTFGLIALGLVRFVLFKILGII